MSHIVTTIHGQEHHVDTGEDEHLGTITLDGQTHLIDWKQLENGQTYEIYVGGQRFEVKAEDERAKLLAGLIKGGDHSGEAAIHAPMPGLVVGVLMEAGAEVKAGQPVVVLEAMKMENDLASPINGKIKEILVNKGQTVDLGDVLVVIGNDAEEE